MEVSKQRIAKNTIMLYLRMILSMVVGIYTGRVVLQTLGAEDYGIYGVVGSVVAMMGFLNTSMAGATSRFITFELGKGDIQRVRDVFSTALIIHLIIAAFIVLLSETVGLWYMCNKLVIPAERMTAAHWVFQFSIISAAIGITQAPYAAVIMSHEKMDIYAYFELLNVSLKLLIVFLLKIGNFDKLILYSGLVLLVSTFMRTLYRVYCVRHYEDSNFRLVFDKTIIKPMVSFSVWDFYGNMSVTIFHQGVAFVMNAFYGPILNAANSISLTLQGVIKGFAFNIIQAFRPPIIKQVAQDEISQAEELSIKSTQLTLCIFAMMAIPVFFNADYLLELWLGKGFVPQYSADLFRIIIVATGCHLVNMIVNILIHAKGEMALFSFLTGSCFLLTVPALYSLMRLGLSVQTSYSVMLLTYSSSLIISVILVKKNIPDFKLWLFVNKGCFQPVLAIILAALLVYLFPNMFSLDIVNVVIDTFVAIIVLGISLLFGMLTKEERKVVYGMISQRLKKNNNGQ